MSRCFINEFLQCKLLIDVICADIKLAVRIGPFHAILPDAIIDGLDCHNNFKIN